MPLVPQYRNRLRGQSATQLKRRLANVRTTMPVPTGSTEPSIVDPVGARRKEILERRLALAQSPGIRQRVLGQKGVETIRRAQNPQQSQEGPHSQNLQARAEALKARLNRALGLTQVSAGQATATTPPAAAAEVTANAASPTPPPTTPTPPKTLPPAEMASRAVSTYTLPHQDPAWRAAHKISVNAFEAREQALEDQKRQIKSGVRALKTTDRLNKREPGYVRDDAQYEALKTQRAAMVRARELLYRERLRSRAASERAWYEARGT